MKKIIIIALIFVATPIALFLLLSSCSTIKKDNLNANAIINVETKKAIRVQNASKSNDAPSILYSHWNWKCMTWEFIKIDENTYQLKNLYTEKTFEPSENPQASVSLWQQPISESRMQHWEFIKQSNEAYLIRLKDTELYVTVASDKNNSPIILMPMQDSDSQLWRLKKQTPMF